MKTNCFSLELKMGEFGLKWLAFLSHYLSDPLHNKCKGHPVARVRKRINSPARWILHNTQEPNNAFFALWNKYFISSNARSVAMVPPVAILS
jgi:hypothetical protein